MRYLALILCFSLLAVNAKAAKKAKVPESTKNFLSEFTHLDKTFASSRNKYHLIGDIVIPSEGDEFMVMLHYDELTDTPVKDIMWISGKKSKPLSPLRSESKINTQLEKMLSKANPSLAYDRIETGKHIISKAFYFTKSKAFSSKKPEPHKLKVTWENNSVIFSSLENLYLTAIEEPQPKIKRFKADVPVNPNLKQFNTDRVAVENESVRQQKQYEYEMLEIESTLKQMKQFENEASDNMFSDETQSPEGLGE